MPIYGFRCERCTAEVERLQHMDGDAPECCGERMVRTPSFPAMVKVKGSGGYPSRRKMIKGTAAYS